MGRNQRTGTLAASEVTYSSVVGYAFSGTSRGAVPAGFGGKNLPMKWPFLTSAGYAGFSTACELNESIGKYVLEEPSLRILTARLGGRALPNPEVTPTAARME